MPDDNRRDAPSLEAERLDADRRYNDALTAVDRAIVRPLSIPAALPTPNTTPPVLPPGWRGRWLRIVHEWLSPLMAEQHAFNTRVAAELSASRDRASETAAALEQFQTTLVVFLQQITAFVDTKMRVGDAAVSARLADQERILAAMPEVRAQVQTLQRALQLLKRREEEKSTAENAEPAENIPEDNGERLGGRASGPEGRTGGPEGRTSGPKGRTSGPKGPHYHGTGADATYVGFEDRFRGSDDEIRAKQQAYLPIFDGASDVLDVGCGRGEFLALLKDAGVSARGIDVNGDMVAVARERGLDATAADALTYVSSLGDESLGGVMCAQVIEHLEPSYLIRLLETLSHKLRPDAPVVIETINAGCWLAFFSSYIRDFTHVRPIHPDTLDYLLHASGFGRVSIRYSAPVPDHMKMKGIELAAPVASSSDAAAQALAEAARVVNANSAIINNLMFSYLDYAAVAYRS